MIGKLSAKLPQNPLIVTGYLANLSWVLQIFLHLCMYSLECSHIDAYNMVQWKEKVIDGKNFHLSHNGATHPTRNKMT